MQQKCEIKYKPLYGKLQNLHKAVEFSSYNFQNGVPPTKNPIGHP